MTQGLSLVLLVAQQKGRTSPVTLLPIRSATASHISLMSLPSSTTSSATNSRPPLLANRLSSSLPQYLVTVAHESSVGLHFVAVHAQSRAAPALANAARTLDVQKTTTTTNLLDLRDANSVVKRDLAAAPAILARARAALDQADAALVSYINSTPSSIASLVSALASATTAVANAPAVMAGATAVAVASSTSRFGRNSNKTRHEAGNEKNSDTSNIPPEPIELETLRELRSEEEEANADNVDNTDNSLQVSHIHDGMTSSLSSSRHASESMDERDEKRMTFLQASDRRDDTNDGAGKNDGH